MSDDLGAWLRAFVGDPGFVTRYPYYAAVLARLTPVADPSVPVMGVSSTQGRFYLHVNIPYFQRHPGFLRGVLLHEVHHVVLGHLSSPRLLDPAHPDLMEIAKEISANEHIDEPLPPAVVLRDYTRFGLRSGQSTHERYELLVAARQRGELPSRVEVKLVDTHRDPNDDPGALDRLRRLIVDAVEDTWAPTLGAQDERRARLAGLDPGKLLERLDDATTPAVVIDWRTRLRMFAARVRAPAHTYSRPARRFPDRIGHLPGRAWASRADERPRLLVAIDTSASMTRAELAQVAAQLALLADHATLVVAEVDVVVHRVTPWQGRLPDVVGRGGTDLRPVFEPELLARHRPHGVVYFTDGEGPHPPAPPRMPTLWVLTGDHPFDCPWGERTRFTR